MNGTKTKTACYKYHSFCVLKLLRDNNNPSKISLYCVCVIAIYSRYAMQ